MAGNANFVLKLPLFLASFFAGIVFAPGMYGFYSFFFIVPLYLAFVAFYFYASIKSDNYIFLSIKYREFVVLLFSFLVVLYWVIVHDWTYSKLKYIDTSAVGSLHYYKMMSAVIWCFFSLIVPHYIIVLVERSRSKLR
jgi:hypothetical protein